MASSNGINVQDSEGRTLLHRAALEGKFADVKSLLEQKADTVLQDGQGQTPLHLALKERKQEVGEVLGKRLFIRGSCSVAFSLQPSRAAMTHLSGTRLEGLLCTGRVYSKE